MRIGITSRGDAWESLNHVRQLTIGVLSRDHEIMTLPPEYPLATRLHRRRLRAEWLERCDVMVGPNNAEITQARVDAKSTTRLATFVLGSMPRGAFGLRDMHRQMQTSDVLVANCSADAALCEKFFENATVRIVPFAYDDKEFYQVDRQTRTATRAELAIRPDEKLVLYSGRLTVEKNVHGLLQTFAIVRNAVPDATLAIVGSEMQSPFVEAGVFTRSMLTSLRRVRDRLGLGTRVMFLGHRTPAQLRAFYSAADVLVNLTLHHDENFGLAQVEAMGCGLPVVGTSWGGLKDTIIHEATGMLVPTVATVIGVKADWWTAADSIVRLLRAGPTPEMRARCITHAQGRYSLQRYGERLGQVIAECVALPRTTEALRATSFAREFWQVCQPEADERPPYRRGADALRLYRDLISSYTGGPNAASNGSGDKVWCLTAPTEILDDGVLVVGDPIFPQELPTPTHLRAAFRDLLEQFAERPVQPVDSFALVHNATTSALAWMEEHGLILMSSSGIVPLDCVSSSAGGAHLRIQKVEPDADLVWFS